MAQYRHLYILLTGVGIVFFFLWICILSSLVLSPFIQVGRGGWLLCCFFVFALYALSLVLLTRIYQCIEIVVSVVLPETKKTNNKQSNRHKSYFAQAEDRSEQKTKIQVKTTTTPTIRSSPPPVPSTHPDINQPLVPAPLSHPPSYTLTIQWIQNSWYK